MSLVNRLYDYASANGYQGTQDAVTDVVSDALNIDSIDGCQLIYDYIKLNGFTLEYATFEEKYFTKWIGTRPKGR